jgi:diguanylate cyclase (GGDEF)-like protein
MSFPSLLFRCLLMLAWIVSTAATAATDVGAARWTGLSDTLFTNHTAPEAGGGTAIVQDGSGFLWVGTQGGLARWDGYHFHRYTADPQTPGSLPDSFILALHVDARGRLWIGTSSGGLARYDAERDAFVVVGGPSGLSDLAVWAITGDDNDGLWVGTGVGLDHVDARGVVQRAPAGAANAQGLPEGSVQALLNDRAGALWVGTRHGLWRRERGAATFSAMPLGTAEHSAPAVTRLYQDSADRIWVGTRPHGAFVIEAGHTREVRESGTVSTLQSDDVMSIVEASPGEVWLGTDGGGIVAVDTQSKSTRRIRHHPDTPTSLSDDDIWALYRDRSGLVWAATSTATSQHDPQQRAITTLLGGTGRPNGISLANVYFVLPMRDGRIWLSVGDGIDIIDPVLGLVRQLRPDAAHPHSALPKGRVQAMVAGGNGEVYIATPQGLYRSDSSGRRVVRMDVPGRSPTAAIRAICFDKGTLWIGGVLDGLWAVNLHSADNPTLLSHQPGIELGDARVTSIERGRGNSLWVGTRSGLTHVDTISGAIERVPVDAADPTRLPGTFVSSTLIDRQGRLWVSSFGSGVQVQERSDGRSDGNDRWRFRRLGVREGLPHAGVDKLLEDTHGDVWASTDNGLAVIDASSFAIRALQLPQGVGMGSFWTNSGAVTAHGELLFGGTKGLAVVRPDRMTNWRYRPPVVVTDAHTRAASLPAGRFNQVQGSSTPLEISSDDRRLRVEFSALDYSAPERNRYAYRLQGFDADWIATEPTSRLASYTNLPPGDYTLQLRGSNRDGEWSQPLHLPIRVLPAWYQTFGFRALSVLCALAFIGALVQARTIYLRRRQRELQALVTERTTELELRSEELRKSQRQLEQIAYADPLTGLSNRRLFDNDLRRSVALTMRGGDPFTLLLIDLDGFKRINDTLGHDAGDALLVATAERLRCAVREVDRVSRLGGDEFAVVLTHMGDLEAVGTICRRIVASLAEPLSFNGSIMQVSASVGSALCPSQGAAADALYKAADVALYAAKHGGRNTWRWHGQITAAQHGHPDVAMDEVTAA